MFALYKTQDPLKLDDYRVIVRIYENSMTSCVFGALFAWGEMISTGFVSRDAFLYTSVVKTVYIILFYNEFHSVQDPRST